MHFDIFKVRVWSKNESKKKPFELRYITIKPKIINMKYEFVKKM